LLGILNFDRRRSVPSKDLVLRENELDTMSLGRVLAESGFFSDSREAAQAVVKVLAGRELGFGPIASMRGVNIIKGKVSLAADLQAAAIKSSPKYDYRVTHHDTERCTIEFFQAGTEAPWELIGESEFTMSDAKAAGLLSNDTWRKYPRNMLFARAMSNGARWYCPDVFGGAVYAPEELGAKTDEEGSVVEISEPIRVEGDTREDVQRAVDKALDDGTAKRKATAPQLKKLAVLAGNFGWSDEERRERAGVKSFTELTFDQAHVLIEAWEGSDGEASPPASEQPSGPDAAATMGERPGTVHDEAATMDDDEPASSEHLTRLSSAFGGASKALLAARKKYGADVTSVSTLTKRQATDLMAEKLG
jgi:hypothetical protein